MYHERRRTVPGHSMSTRRSIEIAIPPQQPGSPSFCEGGQEGIEAWASAVSMTDPQAAAETLFAAIEELNRLEIQAGRRFHALETLRPLVHFTCAAMASSRLRRGREFEDGRARARLAQSLQTELASGYNIIIAESLRSGVELHAGSTRSSAGGRVVVAMHRTITELSHALLRCLQHYTPPPRRLWAQLHQLYRLAESKGVENTGVQDPEHQLRKRTTIADAYARALMLGAARPNTLRPGVLGTLFAVLEDWSRLVRVVGAGADDHGALLHVELNGDGPPFPRAMHTPARGEDLRSLDASALLFPLNVWLADETGHGGERPALLEAASDDLVRHAVRAWGAITKRSYKRMPVAGRVDACVGMNALHVHLGEECTQRAAGAGVGQPAQDDARLFQLALVNASPGGYGMTLEGEWPADLQVGELLGIRERDTADWHVAVLRWFNNTDDSMRIGIELLAPRAEPARARVLTTRGGSDWTSVLILPEISAIAQSSQLITPRGRFRVGNKLILQRPGRENRARLEASHVITDSFVQYALAELGVDSATRDTGIEVDYIDAGDSELRKFNF